MSADSADSRGSLAKLCFQSCLESELRWKLRIRGGFLRPGGRVRILAGGIGQLELEGDKRQGADNNFRFLVKESREGNLLGIWSKVNIPDNLE